MHAEISNVVLKRKIKIQTSIFLVETYEPLHNKLILNCICFFNVPELSKHCKVISLCTVSVGNIFNCVIATHRAYEFVYLMLVN